MFTLNEHLREYTVDEILLASSLSWILVHGRRLSSKISNNEITSTNESLKPPDFYPWHSCMYESKTLDIGIFLEAWILEGECPTHAYECP